MSTGSHAGDAGDTSTHHGHEGHGATQYVHDEGGAAHGTLKGYMTGFVLSVFLTAIPFWLVMARPIESATTTAMIVIVFAVTQIVVHMIYFLHMDSRSEGGWTVMALIFTVVLVGITVSGSLWVMYHLNTNMMPMNMMEMPDGGPMGDTGMEPGAGGSGGSGGAMPGMDHGAHGG